MNILPTPMPNVAPLSSLDIGLVLTSIVLLAVVIIWMILTILPLQIREARVVNGLAKLRKQLLIGGIAILVASIAGEGILLLWMVGIRSRILTEILLFIFVLAFVVMVANKHVIYHQQYTPEHKELSQRIQTAMDKRSQKSQKEGS